MPTLNASVRRDLLADVTSVRLTGTLSLASAPTARAALLKCLAECPSAVVVDLRDVDVAQPLALAVFPAVATHAGCGPDCPVLLCAGPDIRADLQRALTDAVSVFDEPGAALSAAADARALVPRLELTIPPTLDAAAAARHLVKSACVDWQIQPVAAGTQLIVSELVTNVVRHAGTDARLELSLRGDFLHVRVHDDSTEQPRPVELGQPEADGLPASHGRGLHLIEAYSSGWGYVVSETGKVVWATVGIRPDSSRRDGTPE